MSTSFFLSMHRAERHHAAEHRPSIREVARARPARAQRRRRRTAHRAQCHEQPGIVMNVHLAIGPLVALIAGILILAVPRLLNYIVALYLIIIGIIGLFGTGHL
jgi:hypothetical protein